MIKFSWKKINDKFGWNAYSVLEYFYLKQGLKIPPFLNRKIPRVVHLAADKPYIPGPCFLINPDALLLSNTSPNEIYMYLELASKRNIFDYKVRGTKHLPVVLTEEYHPQWVEISPIMKIENDNIYFKYEQEKQNGY